MNLTSESLLLTSALDVRQRFVRLYSLLSQASDAATSSKRRLIDSLKDKTRQALAKYVQALNGTIEGAEYRSSGGNTRKPWSSASNARLAKVVWDAYNSFRYLHDDAYTYISEYVSVPNDLLHYLFRSIDLSLVSETHRDALALYPSRHLMWESVSSNGSAPSVVAAILVPYSETTSPMRWPLLVHELAHHLSPDAISSGSLRRAALQSDPDVDRLEDALSELQADGIAEDAVGPTYALALARESYLVIKSSHVDLSSPTVQQRLEYLDHGGPVLASLPPEWNIIPGSREGADEDPADAEEATEEAEAPLTPEELERIRQVASDLRGQGRRRGESRMVERALALKAQGDPIPAVPRLNPYTQADFVRAADTQKGRNDEGYESFIGSLFLTLADIPLEDSDILEAAWTEELRTDVAEILQALRAPADAAHLEVEVRDLVSRDIMLSRSLQAAAVHRWLLTNDETIAGEVETAETSPDNPEAVEADAAPLPDESSPLSDVQLARRLTLPPGNPHRLVVRPLISPSQVGGTTIDLRLGTEWETLRTSRFRSLDPSDDSAVMTDLLNDSVEEFRLTAGEDQGLVLHPGELLLALTLEYLSLPPDLWGQLEGRSTWARVGLQVHATAGMVDAGFQGFLTLELQNTGRLPIVLYPGLRVGQMAFFPVRDIARPYNEKTNAAYSNQARARTAFTRQHEHKARHKFIEAERHAERTRQAKKDAESSTSAEPNLDDETQ